MVKNQQNILILDDIRSVENVGAMFRTADAVGINKIYLTGYTPCPIDKFNRVRKDLAKSALGAELVVSWEYKKSIISLLKKLKKEDFKIIGIEQDQKALDYKKIKIGSKNAFIVGTEVLGIPKETLLKCDIVAEIPMKGEKESLNVSVALGVALFRILKI